MKNTILILVFLLGLTAGCHAQDCTLDLWPEGRVPNQRATSEKEIREMEDILLVRNVQEPQIEVFLPAPRYATGEAVLIFPGGGYHVLAYDWEGWDIAKWLNSNGIAGIVVKYRLPVSSSLIAGYKAPIQDAQRAIRLVRAHASEWSINPNRIGILGFSAGGHLASTLGTHYDEAFYDAVDEWDALDCRPDFMGLVYAVTNLMDNNGHEGLQRALLGTHNSSELREKFSNYRYVSGNTPRTFLLHAVDDDAVPLSNSIAFLEALQQHDVSVECHFFPKGGHGFALAIGQPHVARWKKLFIDWIKDQS